MMVETILESSQDFSMSNGALPQWKRELLQRRAARARPAPPPAPPPPPPPPAEDEELRYGPGIVKRLKSRYLSLALRDAPRRRPSVLLRRAASLEHLLESQPATPRPPRPPRPASLAAPLPPPARRDAVKRARSVDALSRLESPPPSPPPPPPPLPPPPPVLARAGRPPRRAQPLLSAAERPPPDVVRSTLRKFESPRGRRGVAGPRVSAVLRSSTPELGARAPSPADLSAIAESPRQVSRAALEGIARAGCSVRYSFEAPRQASHLPPLAAANPVLLGRLRASTSPRRVGVIRPMPAPGLERSPSKETPPEPLRVQTPPPEPEPRKESPPSAMVEPIPRSPQELPTPERFEPPRRSPTPDLVKPLKSDMLIKPEPPLKPEPVQIKSEPPLKREVIVKCEPPVVRSPEPLLNGHAQVEKSPKVSVLGSAGIERAWNGNSSDKSVLVTEKVSRSPLGGSPGAARRGAPQHSSSIVFNFSNRKEVPDYIENDGIIMRASKRDKIKAGDPGVVVLRPEAVRADGSSSSDEGEGEELDGGPPSPCGVKFFNDNVLINGRSSMRMEKPAPRIFNLKLQFDDSLTRTFEYPSETSLCEELSSPCPPPAAPCPAAAPSPAVTSQLAEPAVHAPLASNTHIASASLSRYTPHNTETELFQLGVTRHQLSSPVIHTPPDLSSECSAPESRWSDSRASTDLLF